MNTDKDFFAKIMDEANNFENFDSQEVTFESTESFENALGNTYGRVRGNQLAQALRSAGAVRMNPRGGVSVKLGGQLTKNRSSVAGHEAATFDLQIKRTGDLAEALPFAIFGSGQTGDGYRSLLPVLPAGITLDEVAIGEQRTGTSATNPSNVTFIYSKSGGGSGKIEISCLQLPYANFLSLGLADALEIQRIRYKLTTTTAAALLQFGNALDVTRNSIFGKLDKQSVVPSTFEDPYQQQSGIIDIPLILPIDKEQAIISNFVPVNMTITLSFSVKAFNKMNANNLLR